MKKRILSFLISVAILLSLVPTVTAKNVGVDIILKETAAYITEKVKSPTVGSVGGEWAIIGLARSNEQVDKQYYADYYTRVENYVKECGGVLHKRKYTEYSRVIISLTAIGKNPQDVAGYSLLVPLGDFEKTVWQGINGPVWALLALDSGNYEIPNNPDATIQATRDMYVKYILDAQKSDGGWALSKDFPSSDVDITAMVLQALSRYLDREDVAESVNRALDMLSSCQNENGGFETSEAATLESSAQVLTALCTLGIAFDSPEFTKNGKTVLDDIMSYYTGSGFKHIRIGEENQMATEQAFYSLVALDRFISGKPGLYTMTDRKADNFLPNIENFYNIAHIIATAILERVEKN